MIMQSGRVLTHPALARRRFRQIAELPDPLLDLVEASLVIALEEDPALDLERYLSRVSEWSNAVRDRLEGSRDIERIVESINRLLSFTPKQILARELAHLKSAYLAQHDLPRAAASIDRLLILDRNDPYELRDRAAVAVQMHAYREAIECFERYLAIMPHGDDHSRVREQIAYLRAWLEQN